MHLRAQMCAGMCQWCLAVAWEQDMVAGIKAIGEITKTCVLAML